MFIFALPVFVGLAGADWRAGLTAYLSLGGLGLLIESLAVATGWPYGDFSYSHGLGPTLFGLVPLSLLLTWPPLVLTAVITARQFNLPTYLQVILSIAILVAIDLVLDPGAVAVGYWDFTQSGWYYDVPLSNYFGWLLSGTIGVMVAFGLLNNTPKPLVALSGIMSLAFWIGVVLALDYFFAVVVGLLLLGIFIFAFRRRVTV